MRELEKNFKYKYLTARKQRVAIRYKKNLATKTNRLRIHRRQYHQADFSWTIGRGQKGRKRERSLIPYNKYCRHRYVLAVGSPLSSEEAEAVAEDNRTSWLSKN